MHHSSPCLVQPDGRLRFSCGSHFLLALFYAGQEGQTVYQCRAQPHGRCSLWRKKLSYEQEFISFRLSLHVRGCFVIWCRMMVPHVLYKDLLIIETNSAKENSVLYKPKCIP